jgi:hypothetical protein
MEAANAHDDSGRGSVKMGKHFVAQKYLAGFAASGTEKCIWQFDKESGEFSSDRPLPISKISQSPNYYPADVEDRITRLIESPGNIVLDKIRNLKFTLTDDERVALSVYIATMITRVPRNRKRARGLAPKALASVGMELREQIRAAEQAGRLNAESANRRVLEVHAVETEFSTNPPGEIVELIESPWPTERMVQTVYDMHWRFVVSDGVHPFLTSDNPAFFFECWGLKNDNGLSELTFPVSSDIAIFGSWVAIKKTSDLVTKDSDLVKEANRRIAVAADRFVFCRSKLPWVAKIARRRVEELRRVQW